jgi:hypothetical protein
MGMVIMMSLARRALYIVMLMIMRLTRRDAFMVMGIACSLCFRGVCGKCMFMRMVVIMVFARRGGFISMAMGVLGGVFVGKEEEGNEKDEH